MAGGIYYRDPRNPREVHGPFRVEELRVLAQKGILRPLDQVSLDCRSWLLATEHEPELFPGTTRDGYAPKPPWRRFLVRGWNSTKISAQAAWAYLEAMAAFYWSQRTELRQLATEYFTFLQQPGGRREIRVAADDQNKSVFLDAGRWHADLPDCCVVCGEPADCEWNSEIRSVPNLTAPLLGPLVGLLAGIFAWFFFGPRWLVLVGLLLGFLIGYWRRGETVVAVRFRRCRDHLNRTRHPTLRTYRHTLIIGVGDRKVWRRFFYGDREMETPLAAPPSFADIVEAKHPASGPHDSRPSYPTIPLVGDDEMESEHPQS